MADTIDYNNPLTGILQSVLGGQVNFSQNTDENVAVTGASTGSTDVTQNQTQNQTGQTTTAGTTNSATTGTNTSTQTGTSTTKNVADVSQLQEILNKQKAGITPEMLAAIFSEGAKKTPGLITSYANAVGARSGDNSPLATALSGLQGELTNQAATLNTQLLKDSASTAAQIAELTKQQEQSQTGSNVTSVNQNTQTSQQQTVDQLMQQIMQGVTGTNTQNNTTQTQHTAGEKNLEQSNTVNTELLKQLLLGGGGISLLDSLLSGGGLGGIGGVAGSASGAASGAGSSLVGLFQKLIGNNPGITVDTGGTGTNNSGLTPSQMESTVGSPSDPNIGPPVSGIDFSSPTWQDDFMKSIGIDPASMVDFTAPEMTWEGW